MDKETQLIEKYLGKIDLECNEQMFIILEELEDNLNEMSKEELIKYGKKAVSVVSVVSPTLLAIRTINGILRKAIKKCGVIRFGKTKEVCMAKARLSAYIKKLIQYKKALSKCRFDGCKDDWTTKLENLRSDIEKQKEVLKNTAKIAGNKKTKQGVRNAMDNKTIRI